MGIVVMGNRMTLWGADSLGLVLPLTPATPQIGNNPLTSYLQAMAALHGGPPPPPRTAYKGFPYRYHFAEEAKYALSVYILRYLCLFAYFMIRRIPQLPQEIWRLIWLSAIHRTADATTCHHLAAIARTCKSGYEAASPLLTPLHELMIAFAL